MNLLAGSISSGRPRLFRRSWIITAAKLSGTFSQWSNWDCQKAWPEVADRISADIPKVSATGIYPVIMVGVTFWAEETILPLFRVILSLIHI